MSLHCVLAVLIHTSNRITHLRGRRAYRLRNRQKTDRRHYYLLTLPRPSIHRGKIEQILLTYGRLKETIAAITILYRNTKVKVRSPDGDTEYFDIVKGVQQGDTLAPYLFIICLDHVLRTSIDKIKENGFEMTKKRSRRYPAKTITDADYADNIGIHPTKPKHYCIVWNEPPQNVASNIEQVLLATPHKAQTIWPPASHQ